MLMLEFAKYRECLGRHFEIDDWQAVDIVMAAAIAHRLKGEMLWLRIIGASGSGKTEILRSLLCQDGYCETMEVITPSAIRRGMQMVRRNKKTDELEKVQDQPHLLELINGKLVITKELAPLLTKQHESRLELFGLLRSVHDGELVADYGSMQGRIKQKCWFDWILGTTTYVDSENQLEMQLGSRFTDLRWGSPKARIEAARKATHNVATIEKIREELTLLITAIIEKAEYEQVWGIEPLQLVYQVADVVAHFRTPIPRDRYSKDVADQPSIEMPTRLSINFAKIARGLIVLGMEDVSPFLTRLAWDALPPNRACVLRAVMELEKEGTKVTQEAIEKVNHSGLSQQAISVISRDLALLGYKELPWRDCLSGKTILNQIRMAIE
jgi:hypothetical protein